MNEFESLTCELKHIKALLAMGYVKDHDTKKEKILFLAKFGFDDSEIAELVGTSAGTVQVEKSKAKKSAEAAKKKSGKSENIQKESGKSD